MVSKFLFDYSFDTPGFNSLRRDQNSAASERQLLRIRRLSADFYRRYFVIFPEECQIAWESWGSCRHTQVASSLSLLSDSRLTNGATVKGRLHKEYQSYTWKSGVQSLPARSAWARVGVDRAIFALESRKSLSLSLLRSLLACGGVERLNRRGTVPLNRQI